MALRVVVWGTGNVGRAALRAVVANQQSREDKQPTRKDRQQSREDKQQVREEKQQSREDKQQIREDSSNPERTSQVENLNERR